MNPLTRALVAPIRLYQRLISPMLGARCRYYPSCSEYAVRAVVRHGALKGLILAGWRVVRCNPLSRGGVDEVPERFSLPWRSARRAAA